MKIIVSLIHNKIQIQRLPLFSRDIDPDCLYWTVNVGFDDGSKIFQNQFHSATADIDVTKNVKMFQLKA